MGDFDDDDFGAIDYSGMRASDLVSEHGAKLRMGYEYDFGDGWQHEMSVRVWGRNYVEIIRTVMSQFA